jgi:transcriptional regulator with XRE-family HTH domain
MKQPELGKILTNLRNEKGLTQEELVEKCNISVRTIQRIEAGEVTPRSYTVKTILAALDQDLETIKEVFSEDETNKFTISNKDFQLLNLAFYIGIVYFILGFVEFYMDIELEFTKTLEISSEFYVTIKVLSFISMLFFYAGFVVSGAIFKNYLLRISSVLIMVLFGIGYVFDVYSWFTPSDSEEYLWAVLCIFIGCAFVLNGIAVLRLKNYLGTNLPTVTAVFLIITGATFITVLLFLIGLFFLIPVSILQILLLYKIKELDKKSN